MHTTSRVDRLGVIQVAERLADYGVCGCLGEQVLLVSEFVVCRDRFDEAGEDWQGREERVESAEWATMEGWSCWH